VVVVVVVIISNNGMEYMATTYVLQAHITQKQVVLSTSQSP
jgi:hypothetical protein